MAQATCATCRWWTKVDNEIDPWTGKPWAEGRHRPVWANIERGACNRMPQEVEKAPHEWCGEHAEAKRIDIEVRVDTSALSSPEAMRAFMEVAKRYIRTEVHGGKPSRIRD